MLRIVTIILVISIVSCVNRGREFKFLGIRVAAARARVEYSYEEAAIGRVCISWIYVYEYMSGIDKSSFLIHTVNLSN